MAIYILNYYRLLLLKNITEIQESYYDFNNCWQLWGKLCVAKLKNSNSKIVFITRTFLTHVEIDIINQSKLLIYK